MPRAVARRVLLRKNRANRVQRGQQIAPGAAGTFYQQIVAAGGAVRACVIRKVGGIGDVLMITPALRQLKADFPKLHLTFAIDMHTTSNNVYYELMRNCPFVDHLIDARYVARGEYDAVVDVSAVCIRFERSDLPSINRVDLFGRSMGIHRIADRRSWYQPDAIELCWANLQLDKYKYQGKKVVALHTASMEGKRCWPIEHCVKLVKLAEQEQIHFVILDFNRKYLEWDKHPNCTDFSSTTVREMAALIARADLFIGPDSGPMHIAGAIGTPSLVIFGSVPPAARINYYPTHRAITLTGLSCLGCWYKACPIKVKCMTEIEPTKVFNRMKSILELS